MTVLYFIFIAAFFLVALLMCFLILIQESKTLGFGSSFGGDAGQSVFGTSTPEVLKKITGYLAAIFVMLCLVLSFWTSNLGKSASTSNEAVVTNETPN